MDASQNAEPYDDYVDVEVRPEEDIFFAPSEGDGEAHDDRDKEGDGDVRKKEMVHSPDRANKRKHATENNTKKKQRHWLTEKLESRNTVADNIFGHQTEKEEKAGNGKLSVSTQFTRYGQMHTTVSCAASSTSFFSTASPQMLDEYFENPYIEIVLHPNTSDSRFADKRSESPLFRRINREKQTHEKVDIFSKRRNTGNRLLTSKPSTSKMSDENASKSFKTVFNRIFGSEEENTNCGNVSKNSDIHVLSKGMVSASSSSPQLSVSGHNPSILHDEKASELGTHAVKMVMSKPCSDDLSPEKSVNADSAQVDVSVTDSTIKFGEAVWHTKQGKECLSADSFRIKQREICSSQPELQSSERKRTIYNVTVNDLDDIRVAQTIKDALKNLRITTLSPLQKQVLPSALNGQDIICLSSRGTGRTVCHAIAICNKVTAERNHTTHALIVSAKDSSVLHMGHVYRSFAKYCCLRVCICCAQVEQDAIELKRKEPHIIISTVQNLDVLVKNSHLNVQNIHLFVVEDFYDIIENDELVCKLATVVKQLPSSCQLLWFTTAAADKDITLLEKLNAPKTPVIYKESSSSLPSVQHLEHKVLEMKSCDKNKNLISVLDGYQFRKAFVYVATKASAENTLILLTEAGFNVKCAAVGKEVSAIKKFQGIEDAKVIIGTEPCDFTRFDLTILLDQMSLDDAVTKTYTSLASRTGFIGTTGTLVNFVVEKDRGNQLFAALKLRFDIDVNEVQIPTTACL